MSGLLCSISGASLAPGGTQTLLSASRDSSSLPRLAAVVEEPTRGGITTVWPGVASHTWTLPVSSGYRGKAGVTAGQSHVHLSPVGGFLGEHAAG